MFSWFKRKPPCACDEQTEFKKVRTDSDGNSLWECICGRRYWLIQYGNGGYIRVNPVLRKARLKTALEALKIIKLKN